MYRHVIVIPAYNEEERIGKLLDQINKIGLRTIVVVDGDDRTSEIAQQKGAIVLESDKKRGYGKAIIDGLKYARLMQCDYATVMDVGTCDPRWILKDVCPITDVVVRQRNLEGFTKRKIFSRLAALLMSILVGERIRDATFGYRTYNLHTVDSILDRVKSNGHATNFEILGLIKKYGMRIKYMPVGYIKDDQSQLGIKDVKEMLCCAVRLLLML